MLSLLFLSCHQATAQIPVTDAAHVGLNTGQWITNIGKWLDQLKQMKAVNEAQKLLEAAGNMKELKALKELADLVQDVSCLTSEYSFYMQIGDNYSCIRALRFKQMTINHRLSLDLLAKVITTTGYFNMNSEGRLSFIGQAREAFNAAALEMQEYNEFMRANITAKAVVNHNKRTYYSGRQSAFIRYTR
jgi:hypothetical protein